MEKRIKIWKKILEENGYDITYDNYSYWQNVPYAISEDEKFPLAYVYNNTQFCCACLVTLKEIIANEDNFWILRRYHIVKDIDLKVSWKDGKSCNLDMYE